MREPRWKWCRSSPEKLRKRGEVPVAAQIRGKHQLVNAGFPPGRSDEKKVVPIATQRWVTPAAVDGRVPPEKGGLYNHLDSG
jgi:hypothetical protein